jgi:nucleoid-associated protein YgaU
MPRKLTVIACALMVTISGCAHITPQWRDYAKSSIIGVYAKGAQKEFPEEYDNAQDIFKKGEELFKEEEVEDADHYYHFAWTKAKLLEKELSELKTRRVEEARLRMEAEQREAERLQDLRELDRKVAQEKDEIETKKTPDKSRLAKERQLPTSRTVKRGETLPQIAAQADIYNDYKLWPLLYRANRDQIRDPKHIWPGQLLRIPRNLSREEIAEARRYAQEKPIH